MVGRNRFAAFGLAVLVVVAAAACSNSSSKRLTYCTDPTYPPAEFYQVGKVGTTELKRQLVGADIDVAKAVAKRIGDSSRFVDTSFVGIIGALLDKRCDAVISFM